MGKKGAAELRAEIKYLKRGRLSDNIYRIGSEFVRWSGLVCIFYFIFQTVRTLAGQTTTANISFLSDVRISEAAAWIFGAGGIVYGSRQNKLRKDTIEQFQGRLTVYEQRLDPGRTSSKLTQRGETNPEDK